MIKSYLAALWRFGFAAHGDIGRWKGFSATVFTALGGGLAGLIATLIWGPKFKIESLGLTSDNVQWFGAAVGLVLSFVFMAPYRAWKL